MKWHHLSPSTKHELQAARERALTVLKKWGLKSSQLFDLNLILCELLVNAAEHGNGWQPDKKVFLNMRYCPRNQTVLIFVSDEGKRKILNKPVEVLCSERGRGLILINELADRCRLGRGRVWVRKEVRDGEESTDH